MPNKHIFKYYTNRKIYDTKTKKLSNHHEILKSLKMGRDVQIIYNETGDDVTHHALFQLLISEMKQSPEYVVKICKILLLANKTKMKNFKKFIDELVLENEPKLKKKPKIKVIFNLI